MNTKEAFYDYLARFGNDVEVFDYGSETVLSFVGSDGPEITNEGINSEDGLLKFQDVDAIDAYINEGVHDCYATHQGYTLIPPSITWKEYMKKYM